MHEVEESGYSTEPLDGFSAALPASLDPEEPPSRPASAMSNESFPSSLCNLSSSELEYPEDDTLSHRRATLVKLRDGGKCLLCGSAADLVVTRVAMQGDRELPRINPFRWLVVLNLIPGHDVYWTYDIENLMALCKPHADAYNAEVWCWVPGAQFRSEMGDHAAPNPLGPPPDNPQIEYVQALLSDSDSGDDDVPQACSRTCIPPEEELYEGASVCVRQDGEEHEKTPIHFSPAELRLFDVLIFIPDEMPPVGEDQSCSTTRVLRDWAALAVNPYVAFAMALRTIGAAYFPPPDAALLDIEEECLAIREKWNAAVPRHSVPKISPKDWKLLDM